MDDYYEDVEIGQVRSFGAYEVTREEILSFARQYDPQPFHTDAEAARDSMFGGLVASGWHTGAMTMRMLVDNYLLESGALGSPGLESLRWRNPVRPGDVLSIRAETIDKEPWDETRGLAYIDVETLADDVTVMTMESLVLFPRRD
jgi:acyl dehydratase